MIVAKMLCCCLSVLPGRHGDHWRTVSSEVVVQASTLTEMEIKRHVAPKVVIPNAIVATNGSAEVTSDDRPQFFAFLPCKQFDVQVRVPMPLGSENENVGVQLFLDSRPVDNQFVLDARETELIPNVAICNFSFSCPAPGRHVLQARYLRDGIWSHLSRSLYFEIRRPTRPSIVSISDVATSDSGGRVGEDPIRITGDRLNFRVADVQPNYQVRVDIDGKHMGLATRTKSKCCFTFDITGKLVAGVHDVTIRAIANTNCALASQPSRPVRIHYYNHEHYLLRPGAIIGSTLRSPYESAGYRPEGPRINLVSSLKSRAKRGLHFVSYTNNGSNETDISVVGPSDLVDSPIVSKDQSDATVKTAISIANKNKQLAEDAYASSVMLNVKIGRVEVTATDIENGSKLQQEKAASKLDSAKLIRAKVKNSEIEFLCKDAEHKFDLVKSQFERTKTANKEVEQYAVKAKHSIHARKLLSEAADAKADAFRYYSEFVRYVNDFRDPAHVATRDRNSQKALGAAYQVKKHAIKVNVLEGKLKELVSYVTTQRDLAQSGLDQATASASECDRLARAMSGLDDTSPTAVYNRARMYGINKRNNALAKAALNLDLNLPIPPDQHAHSRTFYFAAPAHFPVREFGAQGDHLDREGALIYEDMSFSFRETGSYEVKFAISTPDLPTDLMLQFQIQSHHNGPWYTITIPHQKFHPGEEDLNHPRQRRDVILNGHSEILKRAFGSVHDIRRTGSARFGYGLQGLGNNASVRVADK